MAERGERIGSLPQQEPGLPRMVEEEEKEEEEESSNQYYLAEGFIRPAEHGKRGGTRCVYTCVSREEEEKMMPYSACVCNT